MNIKRAKQEIKDAVQAYLMKDEYGEYQIPAIHQRPILLMGPPGIGKTQIMEQISRECEIGLVAYTITHHTRQSAIGLPFIQTKVYGGKEYSVTEYTMSEIIAAVYEKIEQSGMKEGILFIDEINCVSETLAPTMLQFLQCKMFGNQSVPEGWIIVAAGNPPEYNKSVREFDVVTLDRIKRIDVEANFDVWKEYAYQVGIHPAVLSYLELRKENFYRMENTVDGKMFVTARGWEDLSTEIQAYERHGFPVTQELVSEYITNKEAARKFTVYYDLFRKYRVNYAIGDILSGSATSAAAAKAKGAKYEERLSIISMLMESLGSGAKGVMTEFHALQDVVKKLRVIKKAAAKGASTYELLANRIADIRAEMQNAKEANALSMENKDIWSREIALMESYKTQLEELPTEDQFKAVKTAFSKAAMALDRKQKKTDTAMTNAFKFIEDAWGGDSQEMTLFVTELTLNRQAAAFINTYGNEEYYNHNSTMLIYDESQKLDDEINELLGI